MEPEPNKLISRIFGRAIDEKEPTISEESVSNTLPDKLLIDSNQFNDIFSADSKKERINSRKTNSMSFTIAFVAASLTPLLSLLSDPWEEITQANRYVCFVSLVIFGILTIISGTIWVLSALSLRSYSKTTAKDEIYKRVLNDMKYTAIIVLTTFFKDTNEKRFMTGSEVNFLPYCRMKPQNSIEGQKRAVIEELISTYHVDETDIIDIEAVDSKPVHSTKPVHGILQQNAFVFYHVKLAKNAKSNLTNMKGAEWLTISEMRKRPVAMAENYDVIKFLDERKAEFTDSFANSEGIHIIWNITNKCNYKCEICATHDPNREELSFSDKQKVFSSIGSAKQQISAIDFAGGDPLFSDDGIFFIKSAMNWLGTDKVSVTTTGEGLKRLAEDNSQIDHLRQCEITVDAAHENLSDSPSGIFSRREGAYCVTNISKIQAYSESLKRLVINMPIISDDLSDEEISRLQEILKDLKDSNPRLKISVLLIRLMPVGMMNRVNKDTYRKYNPISVIDKIEKAMDAIYIPHKLHCSLRVLPHFSNGCEHCNMLEKKIGIDCAGNVFACAWGAYASLDSTQDITENPFYLGNLLSHSLESILDGKHKSTSSRRIFKEVNSGLKRHFCSVVSWYNSKSLFDNTDSLSN